jgi:hypothetical protein
MDDMASKHVQGMEIYPKMVYPTGHSAANVNAGSAGVGDFAGVIVHDEAQEEWVTSGNKLEDFGKPQKVSVSPVAAPQAAAPAWAPPAAAPVPPIAVAPVAH